MSLFITFTTYLVGHESELTIKFSFCSYSKEPMFLKKPRCSEAYEGDTVIILCEVIGDPKPEVVWLRDFLKVGMFITIYFISALNLSAPTRS